MKKSQIQRIPNKENETGNTTYGSPGAVSHREPKLPDAAAVPEGAETEHKNKLLNAKKKDNSPSTKVPKK